MELQQLSAPTAAPLVIDDLPMSLEAIRTKLNKAKLHLERYQAFLRLANVEIEQRNRYIIALTTFIYQAGNVGRLSTAMKLALVQALETTNATIGAVVLVGDDKNLALKVHKGLSPNLINILTGRELEHGATALMPYLVSGEGALLEHKTASDNDERQLLDDSDLTSLVSLPLQSGDYVLGAILIGLEGDRTFKPSELCFLMALSQETSIVLDSLRLRDGLWHTAETLLETDPEDIELSDTFVEELDVQVNSPLPIPPIPVSLPEPAEDDLEQLLAAMMEAEDEVQQQNADLQTLNVIATALNRTLELKEVLKCAVEQLSETLASDAAWLYLLDETGKLRLRAYIGLSETYRRGMQYLKTGEGLEGQAVVQNQPVVIEAFSDGAQGQKFWVEKEGLQAVAVVPLSTLPSDSPAESLSPAAGGVTGVLAVGYRDGSARLQAGNHGWSPREMRLLTSIANQVSLAIHNARLYSRLRDKEVSARTGNEILNNVNKMLLERNNALADFTETEVVARVKTASQLINQLLRSNLTAGQRQKLRTVSELLKELRELPPEPTDDSAPTVSSPSAPTLSTDVTPPAVPAAPEVRPQPASPPQTEAQSPPKPFSFEEAVAAGLVPAHILDREHRQTNGAG